MPKSEPLPPIKRLAIFVANDYQPNPIRPENLYRAWERAFRGSLSYYKLRRVEDQFGGWVVRYFNINRFFDFRCVSHPQETMIRVAETLADFPADRLVFAFEYAKSVVPIFSPYHVSWVPNPRVGTLKQWETIGRRLYHSEHPLAIKLTETSIISQGILF